MSFADDKIARVKILELDGYEHLVKIAQGELPHGPFQELLDIRIEKVERGELTLKSRPTSHFYNPYGVALVSQQRVTDVLRKLHQIFVFGHSEPVQSINMHVLFLCKEDVVNDDGILKHAPKMVGTKLGESITYFFDEVLALRVIDSQDDEGKTVLHRWLQTVHSQGYKAKDRSGKLENFEKPDITTLIEKLGFSLTNDMGETNV